MLRAYYNNFNFMCNQNKKKKTCERKYICHNVDEVSIIFNLNFNFLTQFYIL